jgi:hypothetical protein
MRLTQPFTDPSIVFSTRPGGEVPENVVHFHMLFPILKTGISPVLLQLYAVLNMVFKNKGAKTNSMAFPNIVNASPGL